MRAQEMESANAVHPSMAKSVDRTEFVMASAQNIEDFKEAFAKTRLFPTEQPARCCQASGWR
jgi:hypothetical protein